MQPAGAVSKFSPHWIEERVNAEDLAGDARVRAATEAAIQTGRETGSFSQAWQAIEVLLAFGRHLDALSPRDSAPGSLIRVNGEQSCARYHFLSI
jgi:hypothetical protein